MNLNDNKLRTGLLEYNLKLRSQLYLPSFTFFFGFLVQILVVKLYLLYCINRY